ncbi:MAG: SusC/RagA family TonB-linked outer membrane protein [Saprospiraceae bacterium]|nr:SusC/RagA family TonB-linked outer membrane protein [Saprospiraceae bacterium]
MKRLLTTLWLVLAAVTMTLAQRAITGTVTGDDGEPLIGATVRAKDAPVGTLTDGSGRFAINVPNETTTLVFTYTGYNAQEVPLGTSNVVDVLMISGLALEETVVTALGVTREKKSLAYSVQQLEGDQLLQARDPNLVNSLSGKIAGVNVISSSGNVGSSSRIVIRGNTSIGNDNQPLFVVNGIPMDNRSPSSGNSQYGGVDFGNAIQDINPDDIESISVLKGPNAAALYGARGANGVVMITTKTGKTAKKGLGVSYTGDIGFSNPFRLPKYQNKFGQGLGLQFSYVDGTGNGLYDGFDESWGPSFDPNISQNDGVDNDGNGLVDEPGEGQFFDQFTGKQQPWVARPDNVRNIFETGIAFTNSVAITAAGDKSHGRFSFTNFDQKGMVPNTDLKRNIFNLGFGMQLNEKISLDGNATYTALRSDNRPGIGYAGDNVLQQTIWVGRQVDWDYLRANYNNRDEFGRVVNWNHNYQNNPYFTLYNNTKPQRRDRTNGFIALNYQILPWLKAMGRVGTDYYNDNREIRYEKETTDYPNGYFQTLNYVFQETNTDFLLTADKYFSDAFSITATVGAVRREGRFSSNTTTANALVVPGLFNFSNADGDVNVSQRLERLRVNSLLGNISFGFFNFIYLDVAGRNDWSSTLPAANRSYFYPSTNLSLVLSEKLRIPGINYLKLRGGFAEAGKDTDPYRLLPTFAPNAPWGGVPSYTVPNSLPNNNLKPEKARSIEAGLELAAFKNRLRLDVTYYNTDNINQIIGLNASSTTGFSSRVTNAGTINNKGVEVQFGITPIKSRNFTWDIDINWAKNTSLVKDLEVDGERVDEITLNTNWGLRLVAREGEPYGVLVGRRVKRAPDGQLIVNPNTGRPMLDVDANGNNTNFVLGTITPDWVGGIRNSFTWKGLTLSGLIDMRQGSDLFSVTYIFGRYAGVLEESLEGRNTLDEIKNGYNFGGVVDNGDGTFKPNEKLQSAEQWNADFYSFRHDRGVFDASFIKLRELTLAYDLPKAWFQNTFIGGLRIAAYGRNLALLKSNVPHIDPETAFDNSTAMQGIEFGQLPSARTYGLTINANF